MYVTETKPVKYFQKDRPGSDTAEKIYKKKIEKLDLATSRSLVGKDNNLFTFGGEGPCTTWHVGPYFPNQGLNPCPCIGSAEP